MSTSNDNCPKQLKDDMERPKSRGRKKKVVEKTQPTPPPPPPNTTNTLDDGGLRYANNNSDNRSYDDDDEEDQEQRQGGRKYITLEEYRMHLIEDIFQVIHTKMNTYFIEYFKYISIYHKDASPGSNKWKHLMQRVDSFRKLSLWYHWYTGGGGDFNDPMSYDEEESVESTLDPVVKQTQQTQEAPIEPIKQTEEQQVAEPPKRTRRTKKDNNKS